MPSLRGSRRQSRAASPPAATAKETPRTRGQLLLDEWIEPPLKPPAPSFEEQGLERHGVLEHMEPLGMLPSDKLKMRLRSEPSRRAGDRVDRGGGRGGDGGGDGGDGDRKGRDGVAGRGSNGLAPSPALHDGPRLPPSPGTRTPSLDRLRSASVQNTERPASSPLDSSELLPPPSLPPASFVYDDSDDGSDDDYVPGGNKLLFSPQAAMPAARNGASSSRRKASASSKAASSSVAAPNPNTASNPNTTSKPDMALIRLVAEAAINKGLERSKHSDAKAEANARSLQYLLDQAQSDKSVAEVLHVILIDKDNAPTETRDRFEKLVAKAKYRSKDDDLPSPKRVKLSPESTAQTPPRKATAPASAPGSKRAPQKKASATTPNTTTRSTRRTRRSATSPTPTPVLNGAAAPPVPSLHPTASHPVSPVGSSSSDLSSVNEELVAGTPPPAAVTNGDASVANGDAADAADAEPEKPAKSAKPAARSGKSGKSAKSTKSAKSARSTPAPTKPTRGGRSTRAATAGKKALTPAEASEKNPRPPATKPGPPTEDELAIMARKDEFRDKFKDVKVPQSSIRPIKDGSLAVSAKGNQTRSANGVKRSRSDDTDVEPATPAAMRPSKKQKMAKTKISPVKKKTNAPGMAQEARDTESPAANGESGSTSDDNEHSQYCDACGGAGYLICCDGCPRAYHFQCCDPPKDPSDPGAVGSTFFCSTCQSKKDGPSKVSIGLFRGLFAALEDKNPTTFALPEDIRNRFEGVRTGPEGEYEEPLFQRPTRNRTGWEEVPDNVKLKDGKGSSILCVQCGKSSLDSRPIIQCDKCNLSWHLDCLDPPLANPPAIGFNGKRHSWICPRHVENDIRNLGKVEGSGKRVHRVRAVKNPKVVDTDLRRGFKNNGIVEIANETSDDEEFYEEEMDDGVIYRLPESGIKLDFISKVKENRAREEAEKAAKLPAGFTDRNTADQRAALSLAEMAASNGAFDQGGNRMSALVYKLINEAPESALKDGSCSEAEQLKLLQGIIARRLEQVSKEA
ncbi:hypothetical protein BDY21DRAFT_29844 [Lineolata rhizophorae]|uniref:PHD-type domain-containing protein n=1 Tax=Lineolata rhizophorae TaxID=578093 RepID=A0A6A6P1B1_9PEZI|nr:hypothetical protein BDY21DRAFT_29844 [Lineolata rhizophorae]